MRTIVTLFVLLAASASAAYARPLRDDHGNAIAALADVHAAVAEIVRIENGNDTGRDAYTRAAHRALNALVGRNGEGYAVAFGDPGDGIGTLGHVDRMLDQTATPRWAPAIDGVKANLLAAAQNVQAAIDDHGLQEYQIDVTRALANLALVVGRSSQDGVLGGLRGALANTELGVPTGAARVSGCSAPARAPAYGVAAGRLFYVALPETTAARQVPANLDVRAVLVRGNNVILYTQTLSQAAAACRAIALREPMRRIIPAKDPPPALYTTAQARAGAAVYMRNCLQCHGVDLQGTAGPAVAGTEFLKTAKFDGWTLRDVRTTVFENMPFSNPGSLTPKQYADVMAFLLASSCFPSGTKPFPETDEPSFATIKLAPIPSAKPTHPALGTCTVK